MRSNPVYRILLGAAALTLVASSAVSAQPDAQLPTDTRFPEEFGQTLLTSVVTNALDDEAANALVVKSVREYHAKLGGRDKDPATNNKKKNKDQPAGGILAIGPMADAEHVTQAVLDVTGKFRPDLVVISGGDGQTDASIARSADNSVIIDLGQPRPCLTSTGQPDSTGECTGSGSTISFNYSAVEFAVEDAAYLAGVVAARLSRGSIGVISGYEGCRECQRYVEGFINGARSVEPEIVIEIAYLSDDEIGGFSDAENAKTFTEAFIDVYQPDVILPVGRAATPGMIEAACEADVWAVGTGWDVRATRPNLDCVMASVTKDVERGITDAMFLFASGQNPSVATYDLANGGVALTDEWSRIATLPVDTDEFYQEADRMLRSGEAEACPDGCGGSIEVVTDRLATDD